jgi:hypothetical protein
MRQLKSAVCHLDHVLHFVGGQISLAIPLHDSPVNLPFLIEVKHHLCLENLFSTASQLKLGTFVPVNQSSTSVPVILSVISELEFEYETLELNLCATFYPPNLPAIPSPSHLMIYGSATTPSRISSQNNAFLYRSSLMTYSVPLHSVLTLWKYRYVSML